MDTTQRETDIWRSVKKFWLDGLTDIKVFFDNIVISSVAPSENQWIVVKLENIMPGHVSTARMTVFLFTREDSEGDDLTTLRDTAMNLLSEGYIDLYNTEPEEGDSWQKVGSMLVDEFNQSRTIPSPGPSRMRYIETTLKWGAVWWR